MVSNEFRYQLRQEADSWLAEELIDAEQYRQLAQRYHFQTHDKAARDHFVAILIGLGNILIGLGILTFVAANWQDLPRAVIVTLLLSLFIGVNVTGFYLWRKSQGNYQRLGQGLLILGAIILGANMGLMGQMFHINAPFYELLLAWGIGVLAMAYSLRLTSLGLLSIILVSLGCFWGGEPFLYSLEGISGAALLRQYLSLLAGVLFIPLAYWCRSRWIFGLTVSLVVLFLETKLGFFLQSAAWLLTVAFALPPLLLWGYDDAMWIHWQRQQPQATISFQPLARSLAFIFLGIVFFVWSFDRFWQPYRGSYAPQPEIRWIVLLDVLILSGWAVYEWWRLIRLSKTQPSNQNRVTLVVAGFIAITSLVAFWHTAITPIRELATSIVSVLLFLLAIGFIRRGLTLGERNPFWEGIVLIILRILFWFLLSNLDLLFKSFMFILCGVAVIAVGLWFEQYVRTLNPASKIKSTT